MDVCQIQWHFVGLTLLDISDRCCESRLYCDCCRSLQRDMIRLHSKNCGSNKHSRASFDPLAPTSETLISPHNVLQTSCGYSTEPTFSCAENLLRRTLSLNQLLRQDTYLAAQYGKCLTSFLSLADEAPQEKHVRHASKVNTMMDFQKVRWNSFFISQALLKCSFMINWPCCKMCPIECLARSFARRYGVNRNT